MKNRYKRFKTWCYACDHQIVTGGTKCPLCGVKFEANKKYERAKGKKLIHNILHGGIIESNSERITSIK